MNWGCRMRLIRTTWVEDELQPEASDGDGGVQTASQPRGAAVRVAVFMATVPPVDNLLALKSMLALLVVLLCPYDCVCACGS